MYLIDDGTKNEEQEFSVMSYMYMYVHTRTNWSGPVYITRIYDSFHAEQVIRPVVPGDVPSDLRLSWRMEPPYYGSSLPIFLRSPYRY